jgi:hypothetical protein
VTDCPRSIVGDVGVSAPAVSAELVVTVEDAVDVFVSGVDALSVTFSSKEYELAAVSVSPGIEHVSVAPPIAPLPLAEVPHSVALAYVPPSIAMSHCQE